jgi:hypothetical protein
MATDFCDRRHIVDTCFETAYLNHLVVSKSEKIKYVTTTADEMITIKRKHLVNEFSSVDRTYDL